ncbi:WD40/YVTN/BNR-like repeat-containing protein, partial [Nitrosomonas supralitoralis]|uniref:WD40/YVTN/BNR-like repeat-containing protein n=1 Tax=Nitrosomonas supralitoralis TaxID=2116706 RepID=UPI001F5B2A7C
MFAVTDGAYTGWRYDEILRTTDGGLTWTNIPNGMDHPYEFSVLRVSPKFSTDQTVFAGFKGKVGVYRSTKRGDSWEPYNTGLSPSNKIVKKMEVAESSTGYVLFFADGNGALFRRSNADSSWVQILDKTNKVAVIAISPNYATDKTLLIASNAGSLRKSTNGGIDWTNLGTPTGTVIYDMAIAPGAAEIFLATPNFGIFYSKDGGSSFINKGVNLPHEAINNIAVSPNYLIDRTVFCTSLTQSVYKSTDRGDNWTLFNSHAKITGQTPLLLELTDLQISRTYATDKTVFLPVFDGLFMSKNGGIKWLQRQTRIDILTGLALSPSFHTDHKMIATTYFGKGIVISSNNGTTWSTSGWPNPTGRKMNFFDSQIVKNLNGSQTVVSATSGGIGNSTDFGTSWSVKFVPRFIDSKIVSFTALAASPNFASDNEIYLGTRLHGVIQTKDAGKTLRLQHGVPDTHPITSVVVSPNYANDRTAFAATRNGEVWRTQNGGVTFLRVGASSIISQGWPGQKYTWVAISPQFSTDKLVIVGTTSGIYRSTDGGTTWNKETNATVGSNAVVQQVEFSPNFAID